MNPAPGPGKGPRVFELRIYHAAPGKMQALHARFRDHTCTLFKRHGMALIGFWSPTDEKEEEKTLYYLLAYPSKESADTSWKAFREDPDWIKAKRESEKDGVLVARVDCCWEGSVTWSSIWTGPGRDASKQTYSHSSGKLAGKLADRRVS